MQVLATPIAVANAVPYVRRWRLLDAHDDASAKVPNMRFVVQALGNGTIPYKEYALYAYDGACRVLIVNPAPVTTIDTLAIDQQTLSGTPYTTLAAAWNSNTLGGTRAARLAAMETLLIQTGMVNIGASA